ncbi:hypothetical protein KKF84_19660 [Myxococcota bacterium]|nr:hypothetical protein [Myxococcota bacterium]MBU1537541.1 hypothetical protein [Myxococcota bacterium]
MAISPQEIGQTIYPIRNSNGHNYLIGKGYSVSYVDSDGTFKGKDPASGIEGNWLKWEDVSLTPPLGWIWLKGQLPKNVVHILSLFNGIDELILKEEHKDLLLQQLPDLMDRLEQTGRQLEKSTRTSALASFKSTKANASNILSFPSNNGYDLQSGDSVSFEELEGLGEEDDLAYRGMLGMLEESEENSKNNLPSVTEGKDSQGNNIPDDD